MRHELFPENDRLVAYSMKRAWSMQPEEWTLLITLNQSLVVECIQQADDAHVIVGAEEVFLLKGSEPEYSLLIQTSHEPHLQFVLTKQLFEAVFQLVKNHIAPMPPHFLPACCHQDLLIENTLESFFSQALEARLDEAYDDATVPTEPVSCTGS